MLELAGMNAMRVLMNYGSLSSAAQLGLVGATEEVRLIEQQDPTWEAATIPGLEVVELCVRLSISNSSRRNMLEMYEWFNRTGVRPTIFRETVAIKKAMRAANSHNNKLVCAGSLWWIEGCYYYVCWHDGQVHLYPFDHPFGPGFVCPIVLNVRSADLPPGTGASLTTV